MKHIRYQGEFLSIAGVVWRAEIWQESATPYSMVGELTFDADQPILIEWAETKKEEAVCGSMATLRVVSPGDRTYQDLYQIAVGEVRLDVYKDNALYWSGTIDTEFYEEPYERASGYTVTLTFSDFGVLDRLKYDLFSPEKNLYSLREVIVHCIERIGIKYIGMDAQYISTSCAGSIADAFSALRVRADNFVDEDGEVLSLMEVMEGVLQPLSMRIVQREGKIYVYDINEVCRSSKIGNTPIVWAGDAQTMGADEVFNNIELTFSPYCEDKLLTGEELEYKGKYGEEHIQKNHGVIESTTSSWTEYYKFTSSIGDDEFAMFVSTHGRGADIGKDCRYGKIFPLNGGASEEDCVVYDFRAEADNYWAGEDRDHWVLHHGVTSPAELGSAADKLVMRIGGMWLPQIQNAKEYHINIKEQILIDSRYNPFDGGEDRFKANNDELRIMSGYVMIPYALLLYREDAKEVYAYTEKGWKKKANNDPSEYVEYLEYYDAADMHENAGVSNGWAANSKYIGRPDLTGMTAESIKESFSRYKGKGTSIEYPPFAGRLELYIFAGVYGYDYWYDKSPSFGLDSQWHRKNIYGKLRWLLYKSPEIKVVRRRLKDVPAKSDDIEHCAYINKAAKEDLTIDTICGTMPDVIPTAKGLLFEQGYPLGNLKRYDYSTSTYRLLPPEKLLIGTLFSQYGSRHIMLSGEAEIASGFHRYVEANQKGKVFLLRSDVQDLRMGITEAEFVEISPDVFDGIEEKDDE